MIKDWVLDQFYLNEQDWEKDLASLPEKIEVLASFKGKLGNFEDFENFFKFEEETSKLIYRLYGFIHLASDLNLKDTAKASKNQQMMLMFSKISQATSWSNPEIISLGKDKVMSFVDKSDFLKAYKFPFEKLFFQQKHVLSTDQEKILANFGPLAQTPTSIYQALSIVDAKDETVELSDGSSVVVTPSNYRSLIPNAKTAEDREKIFGAVFKRYRENKTAFAGVYNLVLQQKAAHYRSRNHESHLESALFANNIPTSVFHNLKDVAYENTALIKRYINIRKKYLNIDKYRTYDRFIKLVNDDTKYPYEEALQIFLNSIKDLHPEFVEKQKDAVKEGFVDVLPKDGKRTGAYSSGLYGFHPHILLNHDETLDSVFTLAHEAGHSAHTLFSQEAQPMAISDYTIFVAEIASTFNEHVLLDYLLANAKTKSQKIDLLETAIDGIMGTFFRQTLFATYEYTASKMVKEGKPINADVLSNIMIDLYKHYYDIDITEEPGKQYVWAYIPHLFHTPFYVYQYATSYSASLKIYDNIKNNKPNAFDNYLSMLKSGGSDYPVNQAKAAGADLTDKNTFLAVIKRFESLLDELEQTLAN